MKYTPYHVTPEARAAIKAVRLPSIFTVSGQTLALTQMLVLGAYLATIAHFILR